MQVNAEPITTRTGELDRVVVTFMDITARKQAEEALVRVEKEWQQTFDGSLDALFLLGADQRILRCNRTMSAIFNKPQDAMVGKYCYEVVHGTTKPVAGCPVERMRQTLQRETMELSLNGRSFDVSVDPVLDNGAKLKAIVHSIRDITGRKRMEQELRKSIALYHDLVETAQDLIWQCDAEGRYTYLNPAWESVFGYRLDEMLGKKLTDFQYEDQANRDMQEFSRLLRSGATMGYESVHKAKDGRDIRLVFNAKHVKDTNGAIIGTRGTAYDITERKKTEEELRESERRCRSIFEHSNDGFFIHDFNGYILDCNENLCRMLGYSREELVGAHLTKIDSPQEKKLMPERLRSQIETGVLHFEGHHVRKDGSLLAIDVSRPCRVARGQGLCPELCPRHQRA